MKLRVKVVPHAKNNQICGWEEHLDGARSVRALKVRIKAKPLDGQANRALVRFIADWLQVPRLQVQLVRGESSRLKTLTVPAAAATRALKQLPEP